MISHKTARNHVERTYAKIGVSNRIGASMYALRHGLVGVSCANTHARGSGARWPWRRARPPQTPNRPYRSR
jgi:hypothetical protein